MTELFQQGDVLYTKIDALPEDVTEVKTGNVVLAEGEATGHTHRIDSPHCSLYQDNRERRFLQVKKICTLRHEEHKHHTVYPGVYKVWRKREYDHFEQAARELQD